MFLEHTQEQDVKEEMEDLAVCKPHEGGRGSPGLTEIGKRPSADMGSHTKQSTSSKRVRVSGEVGNYCQPLVVTMERR